MEKALDNQLNPERTHTLACEMGNQFNDFNFSQLLKPLSDCRLLKAAQKIVSNSPNFPNGSDPNRDAYPENLSKGRDMPNRTELPDAQKGRLTEVGLKISQQLGNPALDFSRVQNVNIIVDGSPVKRDSTLPYPLMGSEIQSIGPMKKFDLNNPENKRYGVKLKNPDGNTVEISFTYNPTQAAPKTSSTTKS